MKSLVWYSALLGLLIGGIFSGLLFWWITSTGSAALTDSSVATASGESATISIAVDPWPILAVSLAAGTILGSLAGFAAGSARYRLERSTSDS